MKRKRTRLIIAVSALVLTVTAMFLVLTLPRKETAEDTMEDIPVVIQDSLEESLSADAYFDLCKRELLHDDTVAYYRGQFPEISEVSDYETDTYVFPDHLMSALRQAFEYFSTAEGFRFFISGLAFFAFLLFLLTWRRVARIGNGKRIFVETDIRHNVSLPKDSRLIIPPLTMTVRTPDRIVVKTEQPVQDGDAELLFPEDEENETDTESAEIRMDDKGGLKARYGFYGADESEEFIRWAYNRIIGSSDVSPKFQETMLKYLQIGNITTLSAYDDCVRYFSKKGLNSQEIKDIFNRVEKETQKK